MSEINEATTKAFISKERGDALVTNLWASIKSAVAVEEELEHYSNLLEEKVVSNTATPPQRELYREVGEAQRYMQDEKLNMERLMRITKRWEENARKAFEDEEE